MHLLTCFLWLCSFSLFVAAPPREPLSQVRVMLSVITRDRFWRHALSTLSLLESVEHARQELPKISIEWHLIDDASSKSSEGKRKQSMIQDLVAKGKIANFTRMLQQLGTVQVLSIAFETFLNSEKFDFLLHCDDDILVGRSTLARALRDYMADLWAEGRGGRGGGLLALFVNSWLDDQLSHEPPAFGAYALAPFLGGAAYLADRETIKASGNPWAQAMAANKKVRPHEAHVFWLRQLLPLQGLRIWVRWQHPYECQHLGNVNTLNFGRQPEWEPMWAIDHATKRIVEVAGYRSVHIRAALWADRKLLPEYVMSQNARATLPLELSSSSAGIAAWSPWAYRKRHLNYLEIGTADFDTLLSRHVWRPEVMGISIEPLRTYYDRLPTHGGDSKLLLNVAVSDYDGFDTLYFVRPELVGAYRGSENLCDTSQLREVGLAECLTGWVRGTSTLKKFPEGASQLLGDEASKMMGRVQVPCMTYETLLTVYGIGVSALHSHAPCSP